MKKLFRNTLAATTSLLVSSICASGAEPPKADPLLDVLIKKGILTEAEAKQVQSEASNPGAVSSEMPKWKISNAIKTIELYGDARFRWEHRQADTIMSDTYARERFRYAVRIGLKGDLTDNVFYGIRVETGQNPRSTWVTLGDDASSATGPFSSPSSKVNDGINFGQVYLGWKPGDFTFEIGKMPNPIYTTSMVWDGDINPEGLFESYKFSVGNFDLFASAGQFIYQDVNPDNPVPGVVGLGGNNWEAFLLPIQIGGTYKFSDKLSAKVAPVYYIYSGRGQRLSPAGSAGFADVFVGQGGPLGANLYTPGAAAGYINQTGINDLEVLEVPGEFNFSLGKFPATVFGDFAYNFGGDNRARRAAAAAGFGAQTGENKAYQIGFGIGTLGLTSGKVSAKNAWEARAYWQHIEQYALDVNLIDSDFFERGNIEGVFGAFAYGLTKNLIGTFRVGYGDRINKNLGTGGNNPDLPQINPLTKYEIIQTDLTWRF